LSGNTVAGIAGVSAGAAFFVLIPLTVIFVMYWRRRRRAMHKVRPFNPHSSGVTTTAAPARRFQAGDVIPTSGAGPRMRGAFAFVSPRTQPQLRGPDPFYAPADQLIFEDVDLNDHDWLGSLQHAPRGRFSAPSSSQLAQRTDHHRQVGGRNPSVQVGNAFGSIM
jgi:hypothetical protein